MSRPTVKQIVIGFIFLISIVRSFPNSFFRNNIKPCRDIRSFNTIPSKEPSLSVTDPYIGIGAGVSGMIILLINRFSMTDVSDIQSRADIIAVVACSALLLNAVSSQDIEARDREPVALAGYALKSPITNDNIPDAAKDSIVWATQGILKNTPSTSVHVIWNREIIGRAGVVGSGDNLKSNKIVTNNRPILESCLGGSTEVYLPDLQILPGKIEFNYLPINAQSVLILPLTQTGGSAIVVATNQAKVFRNPDTVRVRAIASILSDILSKELSSS
eukprot:gene11988-25107_t